MTTCNFALHISNLPYLQLFLAPAPSTGLFGAPVAGKALVLYCLFLI